GTVRGAGRAYSRRGAQAAGPHPRRVRARLWHRALGLRALPRARSATRLPVGRLDHGNAAVGAADARRHHHHRRGPAAQAGQADMTEIGPLEAEIRRRIEVGGPMAVVQYMQLCLTHPKHGYYTVHDPLGAAGDFITAPEISQMFGELIGLWAAAAWRAMGSPAKVRLVELGPGRGTLMMDALRAAKVMPDFRAAISLHLVEVSPVLERLQRQTLPAGEIPAAWH